MHDKKYTTFLLLHEIVHFMFQVTFFAVLNELTSCRYNLQSLHRLSLQRVIPNEAVVDVVVGISAADENRAFVNIDEMFGGCLSAKTGCVF